MCKPREWGHVNNTHNNNLYIYIWHDTDKSLHMWSTTPAGRRSKLQVQLMVPLYAGSSLSQSLSRGLQCPHGMGNLWRSARVLSSPRYECQRFRWRTCAMFVMRKHAYSLLGLRGSSKDIELRMMAIARGFVRSVDDTGLINVTEHGIYPDRMTSDRAR